MGIFSFGKAKNDTSPPETNAKNNTSRPATKTPAEKLKTCKKICGERKGLYMDSKLAVCSNKGKSYTDQCYLHCEKRFVDDSIEVQFFGRCWTPWKVPVARDNYEWMDKI